MKIFNKHFILATVIVSTVVVAGIAGYFILKPRAELFQPMQPNNYQPVDKSDYDRLNEESKSIQQQFEEQNKKIEAKQKDTQPKPQSIADAELSLKSKDTLTQYAGANTLIQNNRLTEAVPALTDIIVSGRAETDLNGRMGYDWIHIYDDKTSAKIFFAISRFLLEHFNGYIDAEQSRAIKFLCGLDLCKVETFYVQKTLTNLSEREKALGAK